MIAANPYPTNSPLLGRNTYARNVSPLSPSQQAFVRTNSLVDLGSTIKDGDKDLPLEASDIQDNLDYKPGGYGSSKAGRPNIGTLTAKTTTAGRQPGVLADAARTD